MTLLHYAALSAALFCIGLFGAINAKNVIGVLIAVEIMLSSAMINFAAFSRFHRHASSGNMLVLLIISIAAAAAAAALALNAAAWRDKTDPRENESPD